VGLCALGIFLTIPIGRRIQKYVYINWGREAFLYFVLVCLVFGCIGVLYLLIFKLKIKYASNYIWLILCAGFYTYFTLKRHSIPEEAVHLLEYGLLSYLVFRALRQNIKDRSIYFSAFFIALLIGTIDEIIQWIIPQRYWSFGDVGLNGLSAGLFQLVLWKVIRPKEISGKINVRSIKMLSCSFGSCAILLGLCASNTPARVSYYTNIFPSLSFLKKEEPMSEFGYKYKDKEIGIFYSRLNPEDLRRTDETRDGQSAVILNQSEEIPYEQFLRDHNPISDPFLYEIRIHIFRRDTYFEKGKGIIDRDNKKQSLFIAYKENVILEKYFGKTIKKAKYGWKKENITEEGLLINKNNFYESPVSAELFTSFSEKTMWLSIIFILLSLSFYNIIIQKKENSGGYL